MQVAAGGPRDIAQFQYCLTTKLIIFLRYKSFGSKLKRKY